MEKVGVDQPNAGQAVQIVVDRLEALSVSVKCLHSNLAKVMPDLPGMVASDSLLQTPARRQKHIVGDIVWLKRPVDELLFRRQPIPGSNQNGLASHDIAGFEIGNLRDA